MIYICQLQKKAFTLLSKDEHSTTGFCDAYVLCAEVAAEVCTVFVRVTLSAQREVYWI